MIRNYCYICAQNIVNNNFTMKKIISIIALVACATLFASCKNASKNAEEAVEAVENAAETVDSLATEFVEAVDSTVVAE